MNDLFFIGSLFCALLSAYMLLFQKNNMPSFSNKILALLFLSYSYCVVGFLIISSGWIVYFPNLYRTSAPVNYLVPPLAYLYVRSVLKNENNFKWIDILHLIPFVFIAINYVPLYLLETDKKLALVKLVINNYNNNYVNQDGFLSEKIQFLRPIQSVVYLFFQWRFFVLFKKENNDPFKAHTQSILSWLKRFNLAISLTIVTYLIFVVGVLYQLSLDKVINNIVLYASIPVAISLFYLTSYLILHPTVLFGLPYLDFHKKNNTTDVFDKSRYEQEIKKIELFFTELKPYLKQGFSINELSIEIGLPPKLVSFLINNHFEKNFNDFVNGYRIEHVIDRIKLGDGKLLTIHALATLSGFSNKTTFLNAFKKVHHCTPSQYISNL